MKTSITFGFAMALGSAVMNLIFYFLGFHNDPAKVDMAQWLGLCGGLAISITCLILGMKMRRSEIPPTEGFSYGRALGTGALISFFSALFGSVTTYLYFHVINPGFQEVMHQAQLDKMEARGLSAAQIERFEKMSQTFSNPLLQTAFGCIFALIIGIVLSLIIAAFLKRDATEEMPVA
jgi:hypothetical protein